MQVGTKEQKQKLLSNNNDEFPSEEKVQEHGQQNLKDIGNSGINTFINNLSINQNKTNNNDTNTSNKSNQYKMPKSVTYTPTGIDIVNDNEYNYPKNNNNNNSNNNNIKSSNNNEQKIDTYLPKNNIKKTKKIRNKNKIKINNKAQINSKTWTNKHLFEQKKKNEPGWNELVNLQQLKSLGIITDKEYEDRKKILIDRMTGTKISQNSKREFEKMLRQAQKGVKRRKLGIYIYITIYNILYINIIYYFCIYFKVKLK